MAGIAKTKDQANDELRCLRLEQGFNGNDVPDSALIASLDGALRMCV